MEKLIDPICGMTVSPEAAAGEYEFDGTTYYFCSKGCLEKFKNNPSSFLEPPEQAVAPLDDVEYTCPMHPEIVQIGPGSCPICGMALEPRIVSLDDKPDAELSAMTRRFWACLLLTVPVFALATLEMVASLQHLIPIRVSLWLQFLLATPVILWGGFPFFQRGWASIKNISPNMFTLIAIGTGAAWLYSIVGLFFPDLFPTSFRGHSGEVSLYFEAAAVITTLVLLGQVLELRARSQTSSALKALLGLAPKTARIVSDDGTEKEISLEHVVVDMKLRVRANDKIPVDGVVLEGESSVDESMISGEPIPVMKDAGAKVIGGTINGSGSFVMHAEKVGRETLLAQIVQMVGEAQRSKAPIQNLADRVSLYFVPAVVLVAIITLVVWALLGNFVFGFACAVAVLIIACPCALGLATPMSIMVGTGRGAQSGVLIKKADALEALEKIDTLVVDKTGTLTEGKPRLQKVVAIADIDEKHILTLSGALEKMSEHPLASAIVKGAEGISLPKVENFKSVTGKGVIGEIDGIKYLIGNRPLMEENGLKLSQDIQTKAEEERNDGQTVMFVASEKAIIAMLCLADTIKESAKEAVESLNREGIETIMLTGDNQTTAVAVGKKLGITKIFAEVLPEDKGNIIKNLQAKGKIVGMAGDGVNDAPALAQADVGIAMATGTDVAIESSDITLIHGDLRGLVRARHLSHATMRNIRQNLFFAFAYNLLGVPIATGILYPFFGILLSPMIASAAMTFSSVSVIGNALRLRNLKL
ncbi:MAG TPA: heavy metal translocating P-type ATPase [Pyrinomonadaceae bacterium]|nr:heavy metal translocating P-type ATPase [Pyrinomonadaceae bacterium]